MMESSYLLFIDNSPITDDLKNYFAQFNIAIVQQQHLLPIPHDFKNPIAILINWSILQHSLSTIHEFYKAYPVPLLVIHDAINEDACIQVLEAGADDFIVKPIYPRELHARVSAISRRVLRAQQQQDQEEKDVLLFATWRLYPASRRVFNEQNNQELLLSAGEYDLLLTFIHHAQQVLDREMLLQITKNSGLNPFDRRIDVQISRLRQKIEVDAKKPMLIKTIRNSGYLFTAPVSIVKEK